MINPKLIEFIFQSSFIQRWNDYPRMIEFVELDKQAHKFIIAYFLAKLEKDVDMSALIEAGIFEFLRRIVVTDIRPDVFRTILRKKKRELNAWVIEILRDIISDIEDGAFLDRFVEYINNEEVYKRERFILKAASYISTRWEFSIIYQTGGFLSDIEETKKEIEDEIEDYYELLGVRKIALGKKLAKIVDLSGRLRFQTRWAQTPRIPQTTVLGHMGIVAVFSYFYSLKIGACPKRLQNNFYAALFHDLPEALTRDIISPVKYSVSGLDNIIMEIEINKLESKIFPLIPQNILDEFKYLLGLYENDTKKDEFLNKIYKKNIKVVDTLATYNSDEYNAIDGIALKLCDRLAAFLESVISISHGVKSNELLKAKDQILDKLKEDGLINGVDFYKVAKECEEYFLKNSP